MRSIWKFQFLTLGGEQVMQVPEGATPLFVDTQQGDPCIWYEVDTEAPTVEKKFEWHGTGHKVPNDGREHLGSVQLAQGALVFHLYEVPSDGDHPAARPH